MTPPKSKVPPKHVVIVVSDSSDDEIAGPPMPWNLSTDTTAQVSGISSRLTSPQASRESTPPKGLHTQTLMQWYCDHPLQNDINIRNHEAQKIIDREPNPDPMAIENFVHQMEAAEAFYAEDSYFRHPPDPRIVWEEVKEDARLRRLLEDWHR
jgi:hypothetical protein